MTCAEFKELVGAYAIGALDPAERAAVDAHLASAQTHDGCWEALREANEAAALVASSLAPVQPSAAVWENLQARIAAAPAQARRSRATEWLAWTLAFAAIALLLFVGRDRTRLSGELADANAAHEREVAARATCVADLEHARANAALAQQAIDLLQKKGTQLVAMAPQGTATQIANVIYNAGEKQAYIIGKGLHAPTGKDYELWLIRGDKKIPAGLLHGGEDAGSLVTAIDVKLLSEGPPDAIAVTLENTGGGAQPGGPIVLVGAVGKT